MITISNLTKFFGKLTAVDRLTMQIESGELFGFLGPNGAGKTTTINMLTGLIRPTAGTATICGYDIKTQGLQAKALTGLMPDTPYIYDTLTGRQYVRFMADLYEIPSQRSERRMAELLEMLDLVDAGDELIKSYSYGMQKKILLTAVLVHEPRVLFLDEPTSGLDPKSARTVKEILRLLCDRGCTVFMSTHILEIAERVCDRIGIINEGKLVTVGTMDELRQDNTAVDRNLEEIFLELTGDVEDREMVKILSE
ncbi:MAG: ABC transporter ATP-binding protein [Candidatus Poribacteria bacterium]|nr:ABC transporter ATP-binding protein [Candidatus Poribacteria bacterium]